jgi:hypothetical protein
MFDRLRSFAEWYLAEVDAGRWPVARPSDCLRITPGWSEFIIYRHPSQPYQVAQVIVRPDFEVPQHRHPNMSSLDLRLCGDSSTVIGGRPQPSLPRATEGLRRAVPIRRNAAHGGVTPSGAAFLTIQRWHDCTPGFASEDWIAA